MDRRRGAVAGSMALGAMAGAILFAPAASLAQDGTTSPSGETSTDESTGRSWCGEANGVDVDAVIAAMVDAPVETVRSRLRHGKQALRSSIERDERLSGLREEWS